MNEITLTTDDTPVDFEIAYVAKAKHADLYRAAKKMGGQSALAQHIGVLPSTLGSWCNLQRMPQFKAGYFADPKRREELEQKLFALTHKTLDELFPPEIRDNQEFLKQPKTKEFYATIDLKQLAIQGSSQLVLPSASDVAQENERRLLVTESLQAALDKLPKRKRLIVELRYGLKNEPPMTYEKIGSVIGVTKERVRQIEMNALRILESYTTTLDAEKLLP